MKRSVRLGIAVCGVLVVLCSAVGAQEESPEIPSSKFGQAGAPNKTDTAFANVGPIGPQYAVPKNESKTGAEVTEDDEELDDTTTEKPAQTPGEKNSTSSSSSENKNETTSQSASSVLPSKQGNQTSAEDEEPDAEDELEFPKNSTMPPTQIYNTTLHPEGGAHKEPNLETDTEKDKLTDPEKTNSTKLPETSEESTNEPHTTHEGPGIQMNSTDHKDTNSTKGKTNASSMNQPMVAIYIAVIAISLLVCSL